MKHIYRRIQGWGIARYGRLYDLALQQAQDGAHFVEVGAWKGKSTAYMAVEIANSGKKIQFDTVDTWLGSDEKTHHNDPAVQSNTLYDVFLKNIDPVKDYVTPLRMTSIEASKLYKDNSLDFVFLDAGHTYEDVKNDIAHWAPKLKATGIIGGDDLPWRGVKQAVQEAYPNHIALGRSRRPNADPKYRRYWAVGNIPQTFIDKYTPDL